MEYTEDYAYFEKWYQGVDSIELTPIPFESFTNVSDYNDNWYRIPVRLLKYYQACLVRKNIEQFKLYKL